MNKSEQKEMKKIRTIKNTWCDWLLSYILESLSVGGFKHKIASLLKTNTAKQTVYGRRKELSKPKAQNKIKNIWNPFKLKNKKKKLNIEWLEILGHFLKDKKKKRKKVIRKKEINNRLVKDRILG